MGNSRIVEQNLNFQIFSLTNPSSKSANDLFPIARISHDNFSTFIVVGSDAHFSNIFRSFDVQLLIDLKLDRETVSIPSKSSLDMIALLMSISRDNIFNCTG
jgi:hypothetical protein